MNYNRPKTIIMMVVLVIFWSNCFAEKAGKSEIRPKNIIVMISDGCGYNQTKAASLYKFGKAGGFGYQRFPVRLGMATYADGSSYDAQKAWNDFEYVQSGATDSAAAATAMATGVKTYKGAIGVGPDEKPVTNIVERCEQSGKSTGVITSVQWPHATPAGFAAHNEKRKNYDQISKQMIFESGLDVVMGSGHPLYDNDGKLKENPEYKYIGGSTWQDLVSGTAACDADGDGKDDPWTLIETKEQFAALMTGETPKRICGTVRTAETLQQKRSGDESADPYTEPFLKTVPNLIEMTKAAINVLDDDPDGYFLMIEGGAVDWACHDNQTGRLIEEQIEFGNTVRAVVEWIENNSNWNETLLIVTGDHETGYITGPGSGKKDNQHIWQPVVNNGKGKIPALEWHDGGHTNSLIPFFAKGVGSQLFRKAAKNRDPVRGNYIDNTDIARVVFELLD